MGTLIYDVEFRLDTNSKVYQSFLNKAGGDNSWCSALIERALNEALQDLLEKRLIDRERRKDG